MCTKNNYNKNKIIILSQRYENSIKLYTIKCIQTFHTFYILPNLNLRNFLFFFFSKFKNHIKIWKQWAMSKMLYSNRCILTLLLRLKQCLRWCIVSKKIISRKIMYIFQKDLCFYNI